MKAEEKKYILESIGKKSAPRGRHILSLVLIAAFGFIIYGNSLDGEFIWDDDHLVEKNVYIKNWANSGKIFTGSTGAGAGKQWSSYRPLQLVTYAVDYSLWKLDTRGYHLTNTVLHILTALSIYWLLFLLFRDVFLSFMASALFVVHPVHTEAVAYISGRADPLGTLFLLVCFIFYVWHNRNGRKGAYCLMLVAYLGALLSRENSLILPLLLLLYHYVSKERIKLNGFLSILGAAVFYCLLRFTALRDVLSHPQSSDTLLHRMPGSFAALTNYVRLLIAPFNLHMEYGYRQFSFANPQALLGVILLLSFSVYVFRKRKERGEVFFGLMWFLIALLPQLNLYPINAYMAEHWLYLPSVGIFLTAAYGLGRLYRSGKGLRLFSIVLAASLLCFYSVLTMRQNSYWREPKWFYERTLLYTPESPRPYNDLGALYAASGDNEKAASLFKKAIAIDPNYADAHNNLGTIYAAMDKKKEAIASFKETVRIDPDNANAYYNLGITYKALGNREEAIRAFTQAVRAHPGHVEALSNLGILRATGGEIEEAIELFRRAIEIDPQHATAYNNLGRAYLDQGKREEAIPFFHKALEIDPDHAMAHRNLALVYYDMGRYDLAVQHCDRAIELGVYMDPGLVERLAPYRQ